MRLKNILLILALTIFSSGCSASSDASPEDVYDPIEGVNRGIFEFNDILDIYLLEPVARGYTWITPQFFRTGVSNFFQNLDYPTHVVSDLVQLKFGQAATHTGRFLVNSTIGVGGVWDAADDLLGLEHEEEDIGVAFGYHGIPSGPYLVLPILGPSNLRDLVGRGIEVVLNPFFWLDEIDDMTWETRTLVQGSAAVMKVVSKRAELLEAVDTAKEASLDYYAFVRKAYEQGREGLINDELDFTSDIIEDDDWLNEEDEFEEEE